MTTSGPITPSPIVVPNMDQDEWNAYKSSNNLPDGSMYDSNTGVITVPAVTTVPTAAATPPPVTTNTTTPAAPVATTPPAGVPSYSPDGGVTWIANPTEQQILAAYWSSDAFKQLVTDGKAIPPTPAQLSTVGLSSNTAYVPNMDQDEWDAYKELHNLPSNATYDSNVGIVTVPVVGSSVPSTAKVNVPQGYVYSSEPYDVFVKMAADGASIGDLLKYVEQHPDAVRGAYAGRLMDEIRDSIGVLNNLSGEDQFDAYKKMGLLPYKDAEYVDLGNGKWSYTSASAPKMFEVPDNLLLNSEQLDYIQKTNPALYQSVRNDLRTAWTYHADEIVDAMNAQAYVAWAQTLPTSLAAVYDAAGGGLKGYQQVQQKVTELTAQYNEFVANNTQLPDGKGGLSNDWMPNSVLDNLKNTDPQAYTLLATGGFAA
jgi:hypothetical protein